MRRTIMYYPNIEIPDGSWIRKALLYWDEVSSIVPRDIEHDLYSRNNLIYNLRSEGIYRPIYPDQLMNSQYYYDFETECLRKLGSYFQPFNKMKKNKINRRPDDIHIEKIINRYDVHRGKMSSRIMDLLERHNIKITDDWVSLDSQLANIYMSTLAKYSALSDVNHTVIGTDNINGINKVYPVKQMSKRPSIFSRKPILNLTLNMLPSPCSDVSIERVIQFRDRYRGELLSFRNIINEFESRISNSESEQEMKEHAIKFKEAIEIGSREAMKALKGFNINFFLSSLKSIINIKSPTMLSIYTGIVGHSLSDYHPAVILSGVGIAGIVDISVNYMSMNNSTKDKLSDKGFLYLYHARNKGIINDFF